ncbi:MAG: DUF885 family protein, partial [Phycisphaerae bacterium]|nr:DUF885 family protein [Gemmatimonadaceae bacterium]
MHTYDTQLPHWSAKQITHDKIELEGLRARLEDGLSVASDDYHALATNAEALDTVLAVANIRMRLLELSSTHLHSRNPALWTGEAIFGIVSLMIRDFAPPSVRLAAIMARLAEVPQFLQNMRERVVQPVPERWRDRAVRECRAAVELFGNGLTGWIAEHIPAAPAEYEANNATVAEHACAAFGEAELWLGTVAVADERSYAIGEESFREIIQCGHFCDVAPGTLLERAETELERERERLTQLLDGRDWPTAQAEIAADRPTVGDYYQSFERRWREIHDAVVAHDAVTWPAWPIRYVPIPGWARASAPHLYWLFYRSPAPFDEYHTYDYVVTPVDDTLPVDEQQKRLSSWNHSTITLNHVVHHGGVGHHVQNWNAIHRSLSRVGTIAAVDCASRIGM